MSTSSPFYHLSLEEQPSSEDIRTVQEGLYAFNRRYVPDDDHRPLTLFLRGPDHTLVGGLLGATYWGWLRLSILWLHEDVRGQGHGSQLLAAAEQEARRRGCHAIHLDTLSFQALPFWSETRSVSNMNRVRLGWARGEASWAPWELDVRPLLGRSAPVQKPLTQRGWCRRCPAPC